MAGLQKEGKVRWIGVSNFTVAQIERAEKIALVISLQPPYSLIHRQIETETLPYGEKQGIGIIVGARNARQAEGVMRAGELELTPQDIAEIEGTAAAHAGR